ncbi:hypothetical protein AMAG_11969 [Allomyces macrogynus ATCC 38327]|uniref:Uncharacterized protein n=1 Tax=Allomyces macrogynus (strain ATCC 38327) TaxID=578462 RepID=A0A0L0SYE3_ALLM3|nr:hypothetical protein AMAG_11969 [Allomyces macrogynus ATCC 38327]|eukprot:KNE67511.1 hypothetical protein AMAG_11969 [Allomyces macrogynus ATCC 38327]
MGTGPCRPKFRRRCSSSKLAHSSWSRGNGSSILTRLERSEVPRDCRRNLCQRRRRAHPGRPRVARAAQGTCSRSSTARPPTTCSATARKSDCGRRSYRSSFCGKRSRRCSGSTRNPT